MKPHSFFIRCLGCRQHNLKNFNLFLPKNKIIAFTGVSGSGKSSLAFDILFAEAQRRYLEYFSSHLRSFFKQLPKPDIDFIEGLSPPLAIKQKVGAPFFTGTIASYSDIYDLLSLLFTKIGQQHSPFTGERLFKFSFEEMVEKILHAYPKGAKIQLLAPVKTNQEKSQETIQRLLKSGFVRLKIEGQEWTSDDPFPERELKDIDVMVDRLEMKEGIRERLASSIEIALQLSQGIVKVQEGRQGAICYFTSHYFCPDSRHCFAPMERADFNPLSPKGACKSCLGKGKKTFTTDGVPQSSLICQECQGSGLKQESLFCLIQGYNIFALLKLSLIDLHALLKSWQFSGKEKEVALEVLPEILSRIELLMRLGLGYLSLNRRGDSLSSGEARRVQIASQMGAKLSGILYIFDEPSLGLHSQDLQPLYELLQELSQNGNTLILVEHEPQLIALAEEIVELGPKAGKEGGSLVFQGSFAAMLQDEKSLTGQWLSGRKKFPARRLRNKGREWLTVSGTQLHNLKNFDLKIPLNAIVGFCGVSGSGKSTLALDLIGREIERFLSEKKVPDHLQGFETIERLALSETINQKMSPRSIPLTYVNLMTPLRELLAQTRLAKARGYTPLRFSLNKKGGRCEACEGKGEIDMEMELMADFKTPCSVCQGMRYNFETLQITWEGRNIAEILNLSVKEALALFAPIPSLFSTLELMDEMGLGYLTLGQPSKSLSQGEMARLKLIRDLKAKDTLRTLYILDEPSSGLHFEDIDKLLALFRRLVDRGHSLFFIEHHQELLQQADWIIELGPKGGDEGGFIVFEGTPAHLLKAKTATGSAIRQTITPPKGKNLSGGCENPKSRDQADASLTAKPRRGSEN